jgi:hypothetical protein
MVAGLKERWMDGWWGKGRSINQLNLEMRILSVEKDKRERKEKEKQEEEAFASLYITHAQRETEMKAVMRTTGDQG